MDPEHLQRLGETLKARRLELGLSFGQLAAQTGLYKGTLHRIEAGMFAPKPEKLASLSEALGLPLSDLYGLVGYTPSSALPTYRPYLRAKYRDLPGPALDDLERYLKRIQRKYGIDPKGPAPGEDEQPIPRTRKAAGTSRSAKTTSPAPMQSRGKTP